VIGRLVRRLGFGLGLGQVTLGTLFERLAEVHGDRVMVDEPALDRRLTFAWAADLVDRWAGSLAPRLGTDDRVVIALPNGADHVLVSAAVCRAGGIAVPVNPHMRPEEIDHVVADAGAHVVIRSTTELAGATGLGSAVPAEPGQVAALFYTSGTTGHPKGVELTHRGLLGSYPRLALAPVELRRDEVVIALPIAHIMGFAALLSFACAGVPVLAFERFRPTVVLDAIEARRSSVFVGVPAMYQLLLEAGAEERDLSSVRLWLSGADAMPPEVARRFQRLGAFADVPLLGRVGEAVFAEGYGMAELSGAVIGRVDLPGVGRLFGDALGAALPGYRLRVVTESGREARTGETGELQVRGPGVSPGYWGDAGRDHELYTVDGWLRTGDLVRKGAFGTVAFAGRVKDVIKHGGYSVYALEVEEVLARHPAVAEAAALGLPDAAKGEIPVAAVRLLAGARATPEELVAHGRAHLSDYKWPRQVVVVDELPRTGSQKVQKRQLLGLFTPSG
jgi:acyl-CoA synthetase (AMP-forming)/AMP-acid ligase II